MRMRQTRKSLSTSYFCQMTRGQKARALAEIESGMPYSNQPGSRTVFISYRIEVDFDAGIV